MCVLNNFYLLHLNAVKVLILLFSTTKDSLQYYFLDLSKWEFKGEASKETNKEIHKQLTNKEGGNIPEGEVNYVGLT